MDWLHSIESAGTFTILILISWLATIIFKKIPFWKQKTPTIESNPLIKPPVVSGSIPFIGNSYQIYKDPVGFFKKTYKKYGSIFQINLFHQKVVFVGTYKDNPTEFYKIQKKNISYVAACLEDSKLQEIFELSFSAENGNSTEFGTIITNFMNTQHESLRTSIEECAKMMNYMTILKNVSRLKNSSNSTNYYNYVFGDEIARYVVEGVANSLFGLKITELWFQELAELQKIIKSTMTKSRLSHDSIVNSYIKMFVHKKRNIAAGNFLLADLDKYISDSTFSKSKLIRLICDKSPMTPAELRHTVLFLVFMVADSTIVVLKNFFIEMSSQLEWWGKLRKEVLNYVKPGAGGADKILNMEGLLKSGILNACLLETSRLNMNPLVEITKKITPVTELNRQHTPFYPTFANYDIAHADILAVAGTMASKTEDDKFNPEQYDKYDANELSSFKHHLPWENEFGSYPTRLFSLNLVKIYIALAAVNFDLKIKSVGEAKYMSTTVFIERDFDASLTPYFAWM